MAPIDARSSSERDARRGITLPGYPLHREYNENIERSCSHLSRYKVVKKDQRRRECEGEREGKEGTE